MAAGSSGQSCSFHTRIPDAAQSLPPVVQHWLDTRPQCPEWRSPRLVPAPLPLYSPCWRGFLGWSSVLGSRGELPCWSPLFFLTIPPHPGLPSAAGSPADSVLENRSSVLWRKLGGPLLGILASVNLLFLPTTPSWGSPSPQTLTTGVFVQECNLLMSSGSQSAWVQPAFQVT